MKKNKKYSKQNDTYLESQLLYTASFDFEAYSKAIKHEEYVNTLSSLIIEIIKDDRLLIPYFDQNSSMIDTEWEILPYEFKTEDGIWKLKATRHYWGINYIKPAALFTVVCLIPPVSLKNAFKNEQEESDLRFKYMTALLDKNGPTTLLNKLDGSIIRSIYLDDISFTYVPSLLGGYPHYDYDIPIGYIPASITKTYEDRNMPESKIEEQLLLKNIVEDSNNRLRYYLDPICQLTISKMGAYQVKHNIHKNISHWINMNTELKYKDTTYDIYVYPSVIETKYLNPKTKLAFIRLVPSKSNKELIDTSEEIRNKYANDFEFMKWYSSTEKEIIAEKLKEHFDKDGYVFVPSFNTNPCLPEFANDTIVTYSTMNEVIQIESKLEIQQKDQENMFHFMNLSIFEMLLRIIFSGGAYRLYWFQVLNYHLKDDEFSKKMNLQLIHFLYAGVGLQIIFSMMSSIIKITNGSVLQYMWLTEILGLTGVIVLYFIRRKKLKSFSWTDPPKHQLVYFVLQIFNIALSFCTGYITEPLTQTAKNASILTDSISKLMIGAVSLTGLFITFRIAKPLCIFIKKNTGKTIRFNPFLLLIFETYYLQYKLNRIEPFERKSVVRANQPKQNIISKKSLKDGLIYTLFILQFIFAPIVIMMLVGIFTVLIYKRAVPLNPTIITSILALTFIEYLISITLILRYKSHK